MYEGELSNYDKYLMENDYDKKRKRNKLLFIIIAIILVIGMFCAYKLLNKSPYEKIENSLVKEAKKYVSNNTIDTTFNYIMVDKLSNVVLEDSCSNLSGVIIKNGEYFPYLVCDNYETKIMNNSSKYATLNGNSVILIDKDYEYYDLGINTNYTINQKGEVGSTEGIYDIQYDIIDNNKIVDTLTRRVIVLDSDLLEYSYPRISLIGDKEVYMYQNSQYNELGYIIKDNYDNDIANSLVIKNNIDNTQLGEYFVEYIVTNNKGFTTIARRKVIIIKEDSDLLVDVLITPKENVSSNVKIILSISGNNYKETMLPDGSLVSDQLITYSVSSNGVYTFSVYDQNGNVTKKDIEVNNIDKTKPTGVCKATTYNDNTKISVSNVNKGNCTYKYISNKGSSSFVSSNEYTLEHGSVNSVSVEIKDEIGNTNIISCTLTKQTDSPTSIGNVEYIGSNGYTCLKPYTCYKQGDYWDTRYQYCSTESCGPINKRGCSITSVTTILSRYSFIKDKNGALYTPYTLLTDVYNKHCSSHCSGTTASKKVFESFGLEVVGEKDHYKLNNENSNIILEHLKQGNPALIRVGKGWYTDGGHIMALLSANEQGLVYLYDPGSKEKKNSWGHAVNSFVPLSDVIKGCGESCWAQLVRDKK